MVEVKIIRTDDICVLCHKRCERIDPKHDLFGCCVCSGSYIDSLCDTCQQRVSDKEFQEIFDNIKASDRIEDPLEGLKHLVKWGQKAIDYFRKQLSEECQNSECYFEHEGYCSLEKIDLLDEKVDLNISFACPKIKIEEMIEHEN